MEEGSSEFPKSAPSKPRIPNKKTSDNQSPPAPAKRQVAPTRHSSGQLPGSPSNDRLPKAPWKRLPGTDNLMASLTQ